MNRAHIITVSVVGCLALSALVSPEAQAQNTAPPRPAVEASFRVALIDASKAAKPFFDPKLASMKGHLRPFTGKYNHFTLVSKKILALTAGKRGAVKIPGRGDFAITFLDIGAGKVRRVRYQVELPKPRTKMTRRVAPGGQTLDVIPSSGKLTIVSTTVLR